MRGLNAQSKRHHHLCRTLPAEVVDAVTVAEIIDLAFKALTLSLSVGALLIAFFRTRGDRMDRHEVRLQRLEQTVQGLPGKEDLHTLQLEAVKQTGALSEMRAVMAGNAKIMERLEIIVTRHEQHLLENR
ncbi:DUF2730 family protein [Sagittula sp. NFXS13]|uniref:DUF2730 family protein n=1 Tax=Sagittula sp. NFXS13 TaxID=2819095 RepID=UPI0032DFEC27